MKRKSVSPEIRVFNGSAALSEPLLERALAAGALPAQGCFADQELPRLRSAGVRVTESVQWQFSPDARPVSVAHPRRRWHLNVVAKLHCTCERCLEPVELSVQSKRAFEFFASSALADKATAEQAHDDELAAAESDDVDFLSSEDGLSLRDLVEDELLLALPMAPKHAQCSPPAALDRPNVGSGLSQGGGAQATAGQDAPVSPFLGLKDLLKKQ